MKTSRRAVLGGALALAACDRAAEAQPAPFTGEVPALKHVAPFPVGTCAQVSHLDDPDWVRLAVANCSQITPEWEMKMEYIVQADGAYHLENNVNIGDGNDLFEKGIVFSGTTNPNSAWWDGSASNLDIRNISPVGLTMTFST